MAAQPIVCPHCGKDDMIQKVSSAYSGGVSSTQYDMPVAWKWQGETYYGVQQRTATTVTPLAQKLSPPPKPVYKGIFASSEKEGCGDIIAGAFVLGLLMTGWSIAAFIAGVMAGSIGPNASISEPNEGVAWAVGIIVFGVLLIRRWRGDNKKAQAAKQAVPLWEKAITKWNELYYCARDDLVFDPATGALAPADRMSELLY